VSDLVSGVRGLLEDRVGRVWVVGEISNLRRAGSGHAYFTLKDDGAQLRAALFRADARRIPFELEDGLEVLVFGDVTVYEARGDLQLLARHVEPRGRGALQLAFEQLRARLEAEGVFDPARKRALSPLPRALAVVTSASGAALRDVLEVSGRVAPFTPVLVAPTRVQGEGAEHEIAEALDLVAEAAPRFALDVVLLVRGGGALEDLQPFNTEVVARAILRSPIPVVSGVGHEVDVTIADLAADARAPTPSAAAALALPDRDALRARLARDRRVLASAVGRTVARAATRLAERRERLRVLAPAARLAAQRARADALSRALRRAIETRAADARASLASVAGRLDSLSPLAVLGRGYAIVWHAGGAVVRRATDCAPGERLRVRVAEGALDAEVRAVHGDADSR
jgi:exodeoxyribonuclease VII large subunit